MFLTCSQVLKAHTVYTQLTGLYNLVLPVECEFVSSLCSEFVI